MSFNIEHSEYSQYIAKTLEAEYNHICNFRDNDTAKIDLYENIQNHQKIVCIYSSNYNYDVFKKIIGLKMDYLPTIFETCVCENGICLLEEYINGVVLADLLKSENTSVKTVIKYAIDICYALEFLHNNKIVHRDVKPENIIITPSGKAVLIDLQSARIIADYDKKDTINLGTIGYAAPEQFGISPSMPTVDIYAMGVLLNEMILGAHPTVNTPKGRIGKIIKKCTSTQISDRYSSVEKLRKALKHII